MFKTTCKQGSFQITDDGFIQVVPMFSKVPLWQEPVTSVTAVSIYKGFSMAALIVHGATDHIVETVPSRHIDNFRAALPGMQFPVLASAPTAKPKHWYEDQTKRGYIGTYTKERDAQADLDGALANGWEIQGQSSTAGHVNVGRTAGKLLLTGGLGLLTGVSRSKDKITITFVRSAEWLAQHP